jgi:hypothetical protein
MFDLLGNLFATPVACERRTYGDFEDVVCRDEDGDIVGGRGGYSESIQTDDRSAKTGVDVASGSWIDENGNIVHGVDASAQILKSQRRVYEGENENGLHTYVDVEASGPDASLGATYNEGTGTASIGAQANFGSGGVIIGTKDSQTDESVRVGGSYGAGAALRLHGGADADHDGHNEYGIGGDYGFGSIDIKTEDPLRKLLQIGSLGLWDGNIQDPNRTNMSEDVMRTGRGAVKSTVDTMEPVTGGVTDAIAGVEHTQGTRGGAKSFGEMEGAELTMNALFNEGMNPERRTEVLTDQAKAIGRLFGGQF